MIFNIIFKFTNELSQFMLPWQPKHHTIRDFTKNGIFNKKGILDANYPLPAGQNTNNFQHILHNQYLLYKYTNNTLGAQWLSGRVLDSRPKGRGFEPHRRHCVVSLSKTHLS